MPSHHALGLVLVPLARLAFQTPHLHQPVDRGHDIMDLARVLLTRRGGISCMLLEELRIQGMQIRVQVQGTNFPLRSPQHFADAAIFLSSLS